MSATDILPTDQLNFKADYHLSRYLCREDRLNRLITFPFLSADAKVVFEDSKETDELIVQKKTPMSLRDFQSLSEQSSVTPDRIGFLEYLDVQRRLKTYQKTICYYFVYSENDHRFGAIIPVLRA